MKFKQIVGIKCVSVRNPFSTQISRGWAHFDGGLAWVWCPSSGCFTSIHSLTPGQVRRVKALASI